MTAISTPRAWSTTDRPTNACRTSAFSRRNRAFYLRSSSSRHPSGCHCCTSRSRSAHRRHISRTSGAPLRKASAAAACTRSDVPAYDFMLALGNLCIGVENFPDYHARRMIDLLLAGLAQTAPATTGEEPEQR
ncbi:hypothetical protein [Streptomyces sp. NPDC001205]